MKRIAGLLMIVTMTSGFAGMQKQAQAETLHFHFPTDVGVPKYSKEFRIAPEGLLTRYVWEGASIDKWTEALEIINTWRKYYPQTIDNAYQANIEEMKKTCPESTFSIISKDSSSILFERITVNCQSNPYENAFTRILYGDSDVFFLVYTNKVKELPKNKKDVWIKVLSEAKIEEKN